MVSAFSRIDGCLREGPHRSSGLSPDEPETVRPTSAKQSAPAQARKQLAAVSAPVAALLALSFGALAAPKPMGELPCLVAGHLPGLPQRPEHGVLGPAEPGQGWRRPKERALLGHAPAPVTCDALDGFFGIRAS